MRSNAFGCIVVVCACSPTIASQQSITRAPSAESAVEGPWHRVLPLPYLDFYSDVAVSPDGTSVVAATRNGVVTVWDRRQRELRAWTFAGESEGMTVRWRENEIIQTNRDMMETVWDSRTLTRRRRGRSTATLLAPHEPRNGEEFAWLLRTPPRVERDPWEPGFFLLPEQGRLISLHRGGAFDLSSWSVVPSFSLDAASDRPWVLRAPFWLPAAQVLAMPVQNAPGNWRLAHVPSGRRVAALAWNLHERWWSPSSEVQSSPSGASLLLLGDDFLQVIDAASGTERTRSETNTLHAVRWLDEQTFVTLEDTPDGSPRGVRVLQRTIGQPGVQTWAVHAGVSVGNLQPTMFGPQARWFAVLGDEMVVRDSRTSSVLWRVPRPVAPSIESDAAGQVLATRRESDSRMADVWWWNANDRSEHSAELGEGTATVAVSPDGAWVVGAVRSRVLLFDARTGERVRELVPGAARMRWLGMTGVLCFEGNDVRLWRVRDGVLLTIGVQPGREGIESDQVFGYRSDGPYAGASEWVRRVRFRRGGLEGVGQYASAEQLGASYGPTQTLLADFLAGR